MADAPIIIFDDGHGQFGPLTDLRAAFEIRSGELTTAARIAATWPGRVAGYWTPPHLRDVVAERVNVPVNQLPQAPLLLLINGRWIMPERSLVPGRGQALCEPESRGGHVVSALLDRADAEAFVTNGRLPDRVEPVALDRPRLVRFPWEILAASKQAIAADVLAGRILNAQVLRNKAEVVGSHPVSVDASARIYPGVVFDAEAGPVAVHERAVIRPGAVVCGPCSIGHDSVVVDRALIKPHTVIGPVCKVGGEIGATIFQGCSNKAHDGHLGDSFVGKWVNFGAGTTNSNLLNTYGEVTMRLEPDGPRIRTGTSFLGAIVSDHVKTAIGTRIMTGSVIGTGAMIATTALPSTTVNRFAWLTDEGERVFRLENFLDTMRAVMARRNETPGEAYLAAVKSLHERSTSR
jgi:UDP-N-acetylglucosamine diphosphorylase/glucosamine-1-phosphate N-acetyltransferase